MSRGGLQLVVSPSLGAPARYGVEMLAVALQRAGYEVQRNNAGAPGGPAVMVGLSGCPLFDEVTGADESVPAEAAESYALSRATFGGNPVICVVGSDDNGVAYGCFDLAEQVEFKPPGADPFDAFTPKRKSPDIAVRRLQTFLHNADLEREWYYSEEFWDGYLGLLARSRYNEFNLVFGHQTAHLIPVYAYMFELEDYPQVRVEGLSPEDRARNLAALQMISRMAAERGIDFWMGIWQSKPWAGDLMGGQQARVRGLDEIDLADYTLDGIVRLLTLCPDIAGIQLRMNPESGLTDQAFFRDVFIPGLKECGRDVKVEVRNWGLKQETLDSFVEVFPDLRVSFKYFAEHQAMPYQPAEMRRSYSYDSLLRKDRNYDVAWHVWNLGSHRVFLWGDPDYVRTFVASCHLGDAVGFEVTPPLSQKGFSQFGQTRGHWSIYRDGLPDCYEWEHEKYWFFYKLWGRIAYDPELSDEVWLNELERRFGPAAAPHLFDAYRAGSKVVSYLVSHHMDDQNMYNWLELDAGGPIDYFSGITPGEKTLFLNARDYAEARTENAPSAMITPFEAAEDLEGFADRCEAALEKAEKVGTLADNREYDFTSLDMRALCRLARYNAHKIRASAYLSLFYQTSDYSLLGPARECAKAGVDEWRELVRLTEPYYENLQLGPSVGHWKDNLPWVEYDVRRIEKAAQVFERYGIFVHAFDFGPHAEISYTGHGRDPSDYDLVEPRFTRIGADDRYQPETGHGWEDDAEVRSAGGRQLPRALYRGTRLPRSEKGPEDFPAEFLYFDFVRGTDPATFRLDVPDGRYLLTFIIGDASDEPTEHGAMSVSVNETDVLTDLEIPVGETREEEVEVEASGAGLRVALRAAQGSEWVLNGLIVRELTPRIGHLPVYSALRGQDLGINATVTSVQPVREVSLFYRVGGTPDYRRTRMRGNGPVWRAAIPGGEFTGEQVDYYIEAEDNDGGATTFPRAGADGPVTVLLAEDFSAPVIVEHEPPSRQRASEPLSLSVRMAGAAEPASVLVHYRTVDQNADFKTAELERTGEKDYAGVIPAEDLDPLFDEMYYFEALDRFGNGTFYPDPFTGGRYFVVRITQ
ncbi:MAG: hypothetical protein R6X33_04435 [Candidatus Brocadiia bacterium]